MPLVRISMLVGRTPEERRRIADAVHQAMVDTINVPPNDRFQILSEHAADDFIFDGSYLNVRRTNALVIVQITLNVGRAVDLKKKLFARTAELLREQAGVRAEDLIVYLVEVAKENWSFGNGMASFAT